MIKKKKIVIIDYKLSNLFSVQHACEYSGFQVDIVSEPRELLKADAAILPGVGAFGDAMNNLKNLKMIDAIKKFTLLSRPLFGICLGMQLLFDSSNEFGQHNGLGIIHGSVKKFPKLNNKNELIRIPQIGWNTIHITRSNYKQTPLCDVKDNEFMYFVHSYYVMPKDKTVVFTTTDYSGFEYCSTILKKNVFATQYHPEKSGKKGIHIYRTWLNSV